MSIKPLADRVIAKKEAPKNTTASGLLLPDNAKESGNVAVVESVGKDVKAVKAGDRVVYREYSTTGINYNGEELLVIKEEDLLAVIDK